MQTDPLFVIDGIIREKEDFDKLEPYEIDQMSFLKDAATASIYGSAAGNGVVLVTVDVVVAEVSILLLAVRLSGATEARYGVLIVQLVDCVPTS